jgi:hypothetical protein
MSASVQSAHQRYNQRVAEIINSNDLFRNFKRDSIYTDMLEHVNYEQGLEYLKLIESHPKKVSLKGWKKVLTNDSLGNPITYEYHTPMGTYNISPTTLRYMYYALEFVQLQPKSCVSIVEIGGGYGGHCKIMYDICAEFNIKISSYTIIELEYPAKLCDKYLLHFRIGPTLSILDPSQIDKHDFCGQDYVLSYYCFSELPTSVREIYHTKVLSQVHHGYIAWNFLPEKEIYRMCGGSGRNIMITEEVPKTGDGNYIVSW